jgi:hypothetical protein
MQRVCEYNFARRARSERRPKVRGAAMGSHDGRIE